MVLLAVIISSCSEELSQARPYVLTTATTGGTFYPVGVAIATITHAQLASSQGISLTAISSAGSLENLKLLRDNQAQFAILQGPFGAWSWTGEGPVSSPQTHLRSVSALWKNVEHFVLLTELTTNKDMSDLNSLDGHRYVLGARNSGAEQTGRFILDTLGIDYQDIRKELVSMEGGRNLGMQLDKLIFDKQVPDLVHAFAFYGLELSSKKSKDDKL